MISSLSIDHGKLDCIRSLAAQSHGTSGQARKNLQGFITIGLGRCIDPRKPNSGLLPAEIDLLFLEDVANTSEQLSRALPWFLSSPSRVQIALIVIALDLGGIESILTWRRVLTALELSDYRAAREYLANTSWFLLSARRPHAKKILALVNGD